MADNSTLPATGDVIRDLDRTGVKTQIVGLDLNPAGSETLMGWSDGKAPTKSADGDHVTLGATGDASTANTVIGRLKKIIALLPVGLGSTTTANSFPVAIASDQVAVATKVANGDNVPIGSTADAAVITDTTGTLSGKLRGLVKWAFERMPAALGQTTMSASLPVAVASNQSQLPVGLGTDTIYNGATALTPKFAFANVAASTTDGSVVAAVASKKIRVLALAAVAGATATNITFNSKPAGAGSAKTCLFANAANGGEILPFCPTGWFETASGEGLSATTGAGSTTGIQVVYVEV